MSDSDQGFGEKWSREKELGGVGGGMQKAQLWASSSLLCSISKKSLELEALNIQLH